ncbi:hypothetical protein FXO38_32143 [Capsicum annuum]|nr:hypothetical protein FXO37_35884 [Capsicum annuum]KAF3620855.1 hypothetical protein FXO38_32143 [Capsicum annuum]
MGSVSHVVEDKKEFAHDVHHLARLGVRLFDSAEGSGAQFQVRQWFFEHTVLHPLLWTVQDMLRSETPSLRRIPFSTQLVFPYHQVFESNSTCSIPHVINSPKPLAKPYQNEYVIKMEKWIIEAEEKRDVRLQSINMNGSYEGLNYFQLQELSDILEAKLKMIERVEIQQNGSGILFPFKSYGYALAPRDNTLSISDVESSGSS